MDPAEYQRRLDELNAARQTAAERGHPDAVHQIDLNIDALRRQKPGAPVPASASSGSKAVSVLVALGILAGLVFIVETSSSDAPREAYAPPPSLEERAQASLDDIEARVAGEAVARYNMVRASGTLIDACVHAGFVAAAYLQAQDAANYERWKQTERSDCAAAGVPR